MSPQRKSKTRKKIDKIDCRIIELLQKDGRLSNTAMAKELGIAEATIRTRLKRLINEKCIKIVAVCDPYQLGFGITGNMKIRIDIKKKNKVVRELKKLKELVFINMLTGHTDIDADFIVKSLDGLNDLVFNRINKIDGLIATETSLIMEYLKEDYAWGTAFEEEV